MTTYVSETVTSGDAQVDIRVEVDEIQPHVPRQYYNYGEVRGGDGGQPAKAFRSGMTLVRACAEQIADTVEAIEAHLRPSTVEVELGVKLDGEVGALIAKTGVEGHLNVTLTWERKGE